MPKDKKSKVQVSSNLLSVLALGVAALTFYGVKKLGKVMVQKELIIIKSEPLDSKG